MADEGQADAPSEQPSGLERSLEAKIAKDESIAEQVIKRHYRNVPISFYRIKDQLIRLASSASFLDSLIIIIAFIAANLALSFYPIQVVIVLLIVLFALTIVQPFIGLLALTIFTFPIYMYQTPLLAWVFLMGATVIILYGYRHYRVAAFTYLLSNLAFSPIGYILEIPFFIFAILTIGNKRSAFTIGLTVVIIIVFSATTGLQNSGYILYNAQAAHNALASNPMIAVDAPTKPGFSLENFSSGFANTVSYFTGQTITNDVPDAFYSLSAPFLVDPTAYVIQVFILIAIIVAVDWFAVNSRSKYKGALASMFGIIYPISYILLSSYAGQYDVTLAYTALISFMITPSTFYVLEYYSINTVRSLDVRKQDIRMKFGEAFEDVERGNTSETFDDIGNYESTKKELHDAIIGPIEERAISRAYNVTPTKGILFFGPPGTGKTMMMRALANEIHAGFYYVKASNLVSSYAGDTERMIANIFNIAKKNAPCILFFDEVDNLAMNRASASLDEVHRQALSQLLVEMDGFTKVNNVVIVGATNRPDVMDSAILRPGRFDKLIYMPLPDSDGRKKIFKIYLGKLPVSSDININELAIKSERYSGADIKSLCENVAQTVAQEASREHKILEIGQRDILDAMKNAKASTSIGQLESYKKFKLDYERSMFKTVASEEETAGKKAIKLADVVGLDDAKKAIRDAIEIPLLYPDLMKKYDIKPINGLLLFGPPGTGKTMMMRAVTNSLKGVTFLELSGAQLSEQGIERATATIKEIFNRARENSPAVVMMDEIDGILPSREGASELGIQITTQVLKEIDGIKSLPDIVIVGATNRPEALDPAMLRPGRFDKLLYIRPPNADERASMFKYYLGGLHCADNINYAKLGAESKSFTGADIANIAREAKTTALKQEVTTGAEGIITQKILLDIIAETKPSVSQTDLANYAKFLARYGRQH